MLGRTAAVSLAVLLLVALSHGAQPSRVVTAEELLKKIEAGQPVIYDKVTVVGDLNISKMELPRLYVKRTRDQVEYLGLSEYAKTIVSRIVITNSTFLGFVDLSGIVIQDEVNFSKARFNSGSVFLGTKFERAVSIEFAQFKQMADFGSTQFSHTASFAFSQFNQMAFFQSAMFNQTAYFDNVEFNDVAFFGSAEFNQTIQFQFAKFNKSASFDYAHFSQEAFFASAKFNKTASFWSAKFSQTAFLVDTHFNDISLDHAQFSEETFFDGTWFNGTLSLYRTKYDKLNIRWSGIHDLAYDDTAYYLLIENFKKQGFTDDANECYYSYRCKHGWELLRQGKYLNWLFDSLAWWSYGYGLRAERPLGWSVSFIILAGIFFWRSKSIKRKEGDSKEISIWEAFLLSATYFTSGASAIISSTSEEFKPAGKSRYVIVLLRLMGWVFFVLFLSSLSRIV